MKTYLYQTLVLGVVFSTLLSGCSPKVHSYVQASPDNHLSISFFVNEGGAPGYLVAYKGQPVIDTSLLGFGTSYLLFF